MAYKLDLKDRKILYELDLNARQSDSEIARRVRLSREVVRYRINKLQEEGYINYFMTILNSIKLGHMWFRTFFKFQGLNSEKEQEIIDWFKQKASWMTKVEGPWDLNTGIFCKTVYEFRDIINEFLLRYNNHVERYWVSIVTRMWHFPRAYLVDKKQRTERSVLMGYNQDEEYKPTKLDEIDYKILNVILKDARMKSIDIAKKIGITEIMVRYRIKKMIENGVIIGFKPFLDINKLGYIYYKVHIKLQDLTSEKHRQILSYVHHHPNIIYLTELVGGADLEIEYQVKNNEELYRNIKDLKEKFPDIIRDYEFMQYVKEYKFSYLPG